MIITNHYRELLPHIFTFTPAERIGRGSYFLWPCLLHRLKPEHPRFHKVRRSVLPGLSSSGNPEAMEQPVFAKLHNIEA